jgi:hypothetical protein
MEISAIWAMWTARGRARFFAKVLKWGRSVEHGQIGRTVATREIAAGPFHVLLCVQYVYRILNDFGKEKEKRAWADTIGTRRTRLKVARNLAFSS